MCVCVCVCDIYIYIYIYIYMLISHLFIYLRYLTKYNTLTAEADILTDPLFSRIESVRVFMSKFQQDPVPSLTPDTSRNWTGISTSGNTNY